MTISRVHHLFIWLSHTRMGHMMQSSLLIVPSTVVAHLIGLVLLGGSTLIITLAAWGVVVRRPSAPQVARELWPFALGGLALSAVTGILLISANAEYYFENTVFWVKLALIIPAVGVSLVLHGGLRRVDDEPLRRFWKIVSALNLLLWTSVAVAGRAIGLL